MQFKLVRKVPIVEENGVNWFYDTGFPHREMSLNAGVQSFFGIPSLRMRGVAALKRFTKFDYVKKEIITSDDPIPLEGAETAPMEVRSTGWLVEMTVGGEKHPYYIVTGAAYSYVHNLSSQYPAAGEVQECAFDGCPWTVQMRRVACTFAGHPFEILCGDAANNPAFVPPEGVIGTDFFMAFTVVVDRVGKTMLFKEAGCQ